MGKRMITYLLVLGAVGYLFLMYIYPALSGLLIFVLLYPAAGIVYLIFAGSSNKNFQFLGKRKKKPILLVLKKGML